MQAPPVPMMDHNPKIDGQTAQILGSTTHFTVQQKVKMMEAITMGCIEQANTYTVVDTNSGTRLMEVTEDSDDMTRCCCAPGHSLLLRFDALDPSGQKIFPVMTVERVGCCSKPCLGCIACAAPCTDAMMIHAGHPEGAPGELGLAGAFGQAKQPVFGGWLTPTVHVIDNESEEAPPFATVQGPTCFGGAAELCCSAPFTVTRCDKDGAAQGEPGSLANITKMKPADMQGALREAFTDADTYTMAISDPSVSPQQRATLLGTLLLLDYMFFERDSDMLSCENGGIALNCCNCYCMGLLCSYKMQLTGGGGGE